MLPADSVTQCCTPRFMRGGKATINTCGLSRQATLPEFRALCDKLQPIIEDAVAHIHSVSPGAYNWEAAALLRLGSPLQQHLLFGKFTFADGNLTPVTKQHKDQKDSREVCISFYMCVRVCMQHSCVTAEYSVFSVHWHPTYPPSRCILSLYPQGAPGCGAAARTCT
jgi:hypothetical protein